MSTNRQVPLIFPVKSKLEHSTEAGLLLVMLYNKRVNEYHEPAKLGHYNEAPEYFKKCQPMRPKPRFTDCEDAISQICMILSDIDGAIEAQKQMLQIMKEDWTTEGESVDSILREINRLEDLKN